MSYFNPPSEQLSPPPSFFSIKQHGLLQSWKTWMYEETYFILLFYLFIYFIIFFIFNFIILSYN